MKKRQRKKLRLGEFQELGFEIRYQTAGDLPKEERDALLFDLLDNALEKNGLLAGGIGENPIDLFVVADDNRGSVTEEQRLAVQQWLAGDSRIAEFQITPLIDAWYC